MVKVYRVNKIRWDGVEVNIRSFLDIEKAQRYAKVCRNLNKVEEIVLRTEVVYQ